MEVDEADEKFIAKLYRGYQKQRDNINQTCLFAIKKSAREYLSSAHQHSVMENIRLQAREKYIEQSDNSYQRITESDSGLKKVMLNLVQTLSKPMWAGAFATAAVIAVIMINFWLPQSQQQLEFAQDYQSKNLIENPNFVEQQINTTADWQYGFAQQEASAREAFVSGVYAVDLANLHSDTHIKKIAERLSTMDSINSDKTIQSLLTGVIESAVNRETVNQLIAVLEESYRTHKHSEVFAFGRWLEFNYLHAKLTLAKNDLSLYQQNRKSSEPTLVEFVQSTKVPQVVKQDLDQLLILSSQVDPSKQNVEQQARLLEKIRAVLF